MRKPPFRIPLATCAALLVAAACAPATPDRVMSPDRIAAPAREATFSCGRTKAGRSVGAPAPARPALLQKRQPCRPLKLVSILR